MGKLVLFFVLISLSHNEMKSNIIENQAEELREFVYWDAFSNVFNKTADFWKAESAALEAEKFAANRTEIDTWLEKHSNNVNDIEKLEKQDQCAKNS